MRTTHNKMHFSSNKAAKKLRGAMHNRGVTTSDLAAALHLSRRTIENIAAANSMSRTARQKISDYLAANIWPDIRAQTTIGTIPEATVFLRLSEEAARSLNNRFPDSTRIVSIGNDTHGPFGIEFLKDSRVLFDIKNPGALPNPLPVPGSK